MQSVYRQLLIDFAIMDLVIFSIDGAITYYFKDRMRRAHLLCRHKLSILESEFINYSYIFNVIILVIRIREKFSLYTYVQQQLQRR